MPYYLYLFAISIVGMPAGLIVRKPNISYGAALAFLMLLIDVFIGLNTPNPEHIIFVQVVVP